jgi:hypothetical protein
VKANFYNRLQSNKLIKKEGRIPFIEHLTISITYNILTLIASENPLVIHDQLKINDDIKREMALYLYPIYYIPHSYNLVRENVQSGMKILV